MHGVQAEGGPAPEFRCPVAGCKRSRKGFSRHYNLNQHYRRVHGRTVSDENSPKALLGAEGEDAEGTPNNLSEMDLDGSTDCTSHPSKIGTETMIPGRDQSSNALNQPSSAGPITSPLQVLQAEIGSLRAEKVKAVRRFDRAISTLEAALAVLQRDS